MGTYCIADSGFLLDPALCSFLVNLFKNTNIG